MGYEDTTHKTLVRQSNDIDALRAKLEVSELVIAAYMKGVLGRQADVKLLREALGMIVFYTSQHRDVPFADTCFHIASAVLDNTAPKGEQG